MKDEPSFPRNRTGNFNLLEAALIDMGAKHVMSDEGQISFTWKKVEFYIQPEIISSDKYGQEAQLDIAVLTGSDRINVTTKLDS